MRTTLEIEDDVLVAAKELARRDGTTAGRVISDLVRQALTQPAATHARSAREPAAIYGFRPFPSRGSVVSNEQVDKLRDEEGA
jgi:hypothetical protein